MPVIGLFPLAIVLLPAERTALHIFEPRYKELIGECLAEDREFGIVLVEETGLRKVGTRTSVVDVIDRFEDGRLNIIVEGNDRFEIAEMTEGRSYLTAEIIDYGDADPPPPDEAYEECLIEYRRVVTASALDLEEPVPDHRGLAFRVAAQIALPPVAKQQILEMRSETERLALVRQLLEAAAVAARRRMIQERASTNGHVRPA